MKYTIFEDKLISKWNKELLELHQRCCKTYLIQKSLKNSRIKQFFVIYNTFISEKNIQQYFSRPIHIFVQALILDQLDKISNYINPKKNETKKRKRKIRKR